MVELKIDHLSRREQFMLTMAYTALAPSGKDHAAETINFIVRRADELEPVKTRRQQATRPTAGKESGNG